MHSSLVTQAFLSIIIICQYYGESFKTLPLIRNVQWRTSVQSIRMEKETVIPDVLREVVIQRLEEIGAGKVKSVTEITPGPGIQNRHFCYVTTESKFFCKVSSNNSVSCFEAEMASLKAIKSCGCLRVPDPISCGPLFLKGSYLLMEYIPFIPFGQSIPSVVEDLASSLAQMHLQTPPASITSIAPTEVSLDKGKSKIELITSRIPANSYGFVCDGHLGSAPQPNAWDSNFSDFFLERRLIPQFQRAARKFSDGYGTSNLDAVAFHLLEQRVFDAARHALEPIKNVAPCLLHGDLWIGNTGAVVTDGKRKPVVFDPACWYGHHEFDLAIASLFGGFSTIFNEVYFSIIPKADGFEERSKIYKLYHLLNHLNLHGAGFSSKGSMEEPDGYFERAVRLMQEISR